MYSFNSRIRYSEVNIKQQLTLSHLIDYFQDCTTFQSEDLGVGIEYLKNLHHAWVLNSWQIIPYRFPTLGEHVKISTWSCGSKGIYGYRSFLMEDDQGNPCAAANSNWVYIDLDTQRPCRVTPEVLKPYECNIPAYPMKSVSRKISLPDTYDSKSPIVVSPSDIDTNHHVNNGKYVRMAHEFLPADFNLKQMRAEYKVAAKLGDTIYPHVYKTDVSYIIALCNAENIPYAIIEFSSVI